MVISPKCTYLLFVFKSCRPVCSEINLIISCLPSGRWKSSILMYLYRLVLSKASQFKLYNCLELRESILEFDPISTLDSISTICSSCLVREFVLRKNLSKIPGDWFMDSVTGLCPETVCEVPEKGIVLIFWVFPKQIL